MSFRLNIQRRYNPDDYNSAERLRKGIGEAINMHVQRQNEDRDFENQVAMEGGEVIPGESGIARVRRIGGQVGGAIRRKLPGYDPLPEAEENLRARPMSPVGVTPSRGGASESMNIHGYGTPQVEGGPGVAESTGPPRRRVSMQGTSQVADVPGRPSIGGAIADDLDEPDTERAVIRGPHGQSAIVATKRGREQQAQRSARGDWLWKEGIQQRDRVALEKSKYHANSAENEELRQKNRMALLDRKAAIRKQLGDGSLTEYQRRSLELREQSLDQAIDRLAESADASLARTPEPDEIDRRIAERDPDRAAAIAKADKDRTAARDRQRRRATGTKGGATYSADATTAAAQKMWDANPSIQAARPRPK